MSRRYLAAAAGSILLAVLAGCSSAPETTTPTDVPVQSAAPVPTATTEEENADDGVFEPEDYTCETLLPAGMLTEFQSLEDDGFVLQADFEERVRNYGGALVKFADFDGILCQWAYPSGTEPFDYAYSPITESDAAAQRAQLVDGGYVEEETERGTLVVNPDTANFPDAYLFIDGYWFYASEREPLELMVNDLFTRS